MRDIDTVIIHCSATPPSMDISANEIRHWHVNDNGWSDIGYHYVIKRNGELEIGRSLSDIGAHAKGYNKTSIGVCLVGGANIHGEPSDNFTPEQMSTLKMITVIYRHHNIIGHNEVDEKKACPSFNVQKWLETI